MLVSYLDDSGKDPQNSITTLAGYAASAGIWEEFEREAEPIFQGYIGDQPLHAKDLYHGEGAFKGWKMIQKQTLVAKLCLKLYPLKPLGVSFSVLKDSYSMRAAEAQEQGFRKRTTTAYTFCMTGILNWLLADAEWGKLANEAGLAMILEEGNEHNEEGRISLDAIIAAHGLDQVKAMTFVPKGACRAIQMADLFAFYTRRHNRQIKEPGKEPDTDPVLKVLVENLRQRSFVATDFGPEASGERFFKDMKGRLPDR